MKTLKIRASFALIAGLFTSNMLIADEQVRNEIAALKLNYRVDDNQAAIHGVNCAALSADWASCNKATIKLTNEGSTITSKDWVIWFHSIRQILQVANEQFRIIHVIGDLHKLEPTEKFTGFPANSTIEIPIINEYWQLFISDVLPRWYVTSTNTLPKVIENTDTDKLEQFVMPIGGQWKRTSEDKNILMTPNTRFEKNALVTLAPEEALRGQISPTPLEAKIYQKDADFSKGVKLTLAGLTQPTTEAVLTRLKMFGVQTGSGYSIRTEIVPKAFSGSKATSGSYVLNINEKEALVTGFDQAGAFYGLQSILSLIPATGAKKIAQLEAKDSPRFPYRGIFIDVGRNFHSKAAILRTIDQMAAWKLNKLHLHLSDDEGWRLEIPGLPELTDIGGRRCHDLTERTCLLPQLGSGPSSNNNGSGYFTQADYIDIVKYANARHIEVIPEIDMPAHARAAVIAMEARYTRLMHEGKKQQANQYRLLDPTDTSNTTTVQFYNRTSYLNPCLASSLAFVDKVIGEVYKMHDKAGQPLKTWHFGGDEAKNIYLGSGYTDKAQPVAGKGQIDMRLQDKPWSKSEACQTILKAGKVADIAHLPGWFAVEVSKIAHRHKIEKIQAWQDGLKGIKDASAFATQRVGVNFWDTISGGGFNSVTDWTNKGYEVVLSNPDYLYLDFPYEVNPDESGYYWGTRFTDERKLFSFSPGNLPQNAETSFDRDGNFFSAKSDKFWPGAHGLSAQVWSEVVRTDEEMEARLYPRLFSVAERAWHQANWEQPYQVGRQYKGGETHYLDRKVLDNDWIRFSNLVGQRELEKLDKAGIAYRVPVPGARIVQGILEANIALPGMTIEYSTDAGKTWYPYHDHAKPRISNTVHIRSISKDGKLFSRMEEVK